MVLITIYHGKSTERPHHTNVVQNFAIYVCPDTLPNKRTELISKCRHRNNFFWPKLRDNCHGMVPNYLPPISL